MASKQQGLSKYPLRRTARKQLHNLYKSQGAPAKSMGSPPALLGKLLTSLASRLTLPKLHLATSNFAKCYCEVKFDGR